MSREVDVIIVNYKTPELTVAAVKSVQEDSIVNRIFVIDNNSEDNSCAIFQEAFKNKSYITIIPLDKNIGFGGANNFAAKMSKSRFLFLLNSDAYLYRGSLSDLRTVLEQNSRVAIVAPKVVLPDKTTIQADALGVFPTPWSILTRTNSKESTNTDWVSGVSFMVRREEFNGIGGFNPKLFMYFEDVELCWKYLKSGKKVFIEKSVIVVHLGGQSKESTRWQKKQYYYSQDILLQEMGYNKFLRTLVLVARVPYVIYRSQTQWKN